MRQNQKLDSVIGAAADFFFSGKSARPSDILSRKKKAVKHFIYLVARYRDINFSFLSNAPP